MLLIFGYVKALVRSWMFLYEGESPKQDHCSVKERGIDNLLPSIFQVLCSSVHLLPLTFWEDPTPYHCSMKERVDMIDGGRRRIFVAWRNPSDLERHEGIRLLQNFSNRTIGVFIVNASVLGLRGCTISSASCHSWCMITSLEMSLLCNGVCGDWESTWWNFSQWSQQNWMA